MYRMERFSEQRTWPGRGLGVGMCPEEEQENRLLSETCGEGRAGNGCTTP